MEYRTKTDLSAEQRRARRRRAKHKKTVLYVLVIALLVCVANWIRISIHNSRPWNQVDNFQTRPYACVVEFGMLRILPGRPEVRSLPAASLYEVAGWTPAGTKLDAIKATTSYGRFADKDGDGCVISVSEVQISKADPWNGPFVGVKLDDLSAAVIALLPSDVTKDPDGTIWISSQYIQMDNIHPSNDSASK